jgi:hypothetical protein
MNDTVLPNGKEGAPDFKDVVERIKARRDADPKKFDAEMRREEEERHRAIYEFQQRNGREELDRLKGCLNLLSKDEREKWWRTNFQREKILDQAATESVVNSLWPTRQEDRRRPPPKWLVQDLIQENTDVFIYGPTGSLKSFLALALGFGICTGKPVLGFEVLTTGPVFYWCGEGYYDLSSKRCVAWEMAHGYEPYSDLGLRIAEAVPTITDQELIDRYVRGARDVLKSLGVEKAGGFIIDTMSRALAGQDEDKSSVATRYLNIVQAIRQAIGGISITIGHTGWDTTRSRGSSAYPQGYDTQIRLRGVKNPETRQHTVEIYMQKQKGMDAEQTYYAQSRYVAGHDEFHGSLVLDRVDEEVGGPAFAAANTTDKGDKGLSTQEVEAGIKALKQFGGVEKNTSKLARKIAEQTGRNAETVRITLATGHEPGSRFYKYWHNDEGWCMPGCHLEGCLEPISSQLSSLKTEIFN